MDVDQAEVLAEVSLLELGRRLRVAREAKGLTLSALAGESMSLAYLSRIERGQRRPKPVVLEGLAARLGTTVDLLLHGVPRYQVEQVRLAVDFSELALECGDPQEGESRSREALDRAAKAGLQDLEARARLVLGRSLEAQSRFDEAIGQFETVTRDASAWTERIRAGVALCRTYREAGDFDLAIECGERLVTGLREAGLEGTDEGVQLAVTLAAAHYENGDTGRGVRVCAQAVSHAERSGSPVARASAYWHASIFQERKGAIPDAVTLAARAVALMGEGQDARNLARLRSTLGTMLLTLDPPALDEARGHLEQAARELSWSSRGDVDRARNDLGLARLALLEGDPGPARQQGAAIYSAMRDSAPLVAAKAKALEGSAVAADGDAVGATAAYRDAATLLTGIGADQGVAGLWFDLAELLEQLGELDSAREAFKSAAVSAGLRGRVFRPAHDASPANGSGTRTLAAALTADEVVGVELVDFEDSGIL